MAKRARLKDFSYDEAAQPPKHTRTQLALSDANRGSASTSTSTASTTFTPSYAKLTPLERQVAALQEQQPGTLLAVHVGYKYLFFNESAVKASHTLRIALYNKNHSQMASVPEGRISFHLQRLVDAGHIVGIVSQEKNATPGVTQALFERHVTSLFSKATYIGPNEDSRVPWTLVCVIEKNDSICLVSLCLVTGECNYCEFRDDRLRSNLNAYVMHMNPGEVIFMGLVSQETRSSFPPGTVVHESAMTHASLALEEMGDFTPLATEVLSQSSQQLDDMVAAFEQEDIDGPNDLTPLDQGPPALRDQLPHLPDRVLQCCHAIYVHLKPFKLQDSFLQTSMAPFEDRECMTLPASTLKSLEVFESKGDTCLYSFMDHCKTPHGSVLLRQWLGRPLKNAYMVKQRWDAVQELIETPSLMKELNNMFLTTPDLSRLLMRVTSKQAHPREVLRMLDAYMRLGNESWRLVNVVRAPLLKQMFRRMIAALRPVQRLLDCIDRERAKDDVFDRLVHTQDTAVTDNLRSMMDMVDSGLQDELSLCEEILGRRVEYCNVSDEPYLISVSRDEVSKVPDTWLLVSATAAAKRYRTAQAAVFMQERAGLEKELESESIKAYHTFLESVIECKRAMKQAISACAATDCLFSFAKCALDGRYVRPVLVQDKDAPFMELQDLRHPVVESMSLHPYIASDIFLSRDTQQCVLLTGPNMGGKSSWTRAIGLCLILAQTGCFTPCKACRMSLVDGIYIRSGASDDIMHHRSTFLVELQETCQIVRQATERSFVVLDELGRGTGTAHAEALATAVLLYILTQIRCLCIFVTHLATPVDLVKYGNQRVVRRIACMYMAVARNSGRLVFTYRPQPGVSEQSLGFDVASLAGIPADIVARAQQMSTQLQDVRIMKRERINEFLRSVLDEKRKDAAQDGGNFQDDGNTLQKWVLACERVLGV